MRWFGILFGESSTICGCLVILNLAFLVIRQSVATTALDYSSKTHPYLAFSNVTLDVRCWILGMRKKVLSEGKTQTHNLRKNTTMFLHILWKYATGMSANPDKCWALLALLCVVLVKPLAVVKTISTGWSNEDLIMRKEKIHRLRSTMEGTRF